MMSELLYVLHKDWKAKTTEQLAALATKFEAGEYLHVQHRLDLPAASATAIYAELFESLGVTNVERNGKGSAYYCLSMTASAEAKAILTASGFTNITSWVSEETYEFLGFKVVLPKPSD
jgi:rhodanese-related sulfurtransferase